MLARSPGDRLRIDVLGPLRVRRHDGNDVTPDGGLQRRLLALLVLHRGRVVSVDAAVDALWPERRPRDPVASLQNHLFRLRRGLPDGVIESASNGYRLDPAAVELDADRLAAALETTDLATIDDVLARWQGPAFPDLADVDDGRVESARLGELRIRAVEARADARLSAGATDGLVVELAALADEEPLRERPRALLMTALAASGRTAEALRVYDDFRRRLSDELGIEPSAALSAYHVTLLGATDDDTWTPASRLPVSVTSLLGRETLVAEVMQLVAAHRLVTLIGPGGVGKTRMLGEIGRRLRADRPDRPVVMCELAAAGEDSVVDTVAAALRIDGRPGVGLADRVAAVLGDTEIVLLLDNCEHVLDPVARLAEHLLATCPDVTLVATSRERLRVAGEQLSSVPTLATSASDAPAVQLFVERARAVAPGFDPGPDELAAITEIVRRLDGLPLAIELAAARLLTLDVAEVADGLDRRFLLLSSGYRTSTRHGSLHAAVSWSFDLLEPALQEFFSDLSVFAAAFPAAEAAAISGVDVEAATVALDELVERSLVRRAPGRRFVLLETLRAFGAEQLAATGRAALAGERHARHCIDWLEDVDRRAVETTGDAVLTQIDDTLPELRAALSWLLDHGEVELAGRLVTPLLDYGFLRLRPDVLAWSERVADADPDDRSPLAAVVWALAAHAAWMAGDLAEHSERVARAVAAGKQHGDDLPSEVCIVCANDALFGGRLDEAATWYRRAQAAAADDRAQHVMAASTLVLALAYADDPAADDAATAILDEVGETITPYAAYAWFCAGEADLAVDVDRARTRLARAIELADMTKASIVAGIAGASKASIDARVGDAEAAADDYRRLINHWRRAGMWSTQWTMLRSIAGLLLRLERPFEAAVLLGAVTSTQAGHRIFGRDAATLARLDADLRDLLGATAFEAALDEGAVLDGDAAVELVLRAL